MKSDDSDKMTKLGLHSVVYDLRAWLVREESNLRRKARNRDKAGDQTGRTEAWEQAEGLTLCRAQLDDLMNQLKLATKVVKRTAPLVAEEPDTCVDDPSVYLPTPEEIAAQTAELRAEWSDNEHNQRHWQKTQPVDLSDPTNFIF